MKKHLSAFALILGFLLFPRASHALLSAGKVHFKIDKNSLICDVDFGFHYNTKAPISLEVGGKSLQPIQKQEKSLEFNLSLVQEEAFKVHFYVCDDALTVCEPHDYSMQIRDKHLSILASNESAVSTPPPKSQEQWEKELVPNANGFIEDQFPKALALAQKEKKLLLVDFRAPWCPACLRLETETFNQKNFERATSKFIKVSLNIDLPENKEISDQFSVKAIPTVIVMSVEQSEIYRSLDFKSADAFIKDFSKLSTKQIQAESNLVQKATKGEQKSIALVFKKVFDSTQYQESLQWFQKIKSPTPAQKLMAANAEVGLVADSKDVRLKTEKYRNAIRDFPESYESIVWRNELAQLYADEIPKNSELLTVVQNNIAVISKFLAQPKLMQKAFADNFQGDFSQFEKAEVLAQKIESLKFIDDQAALKQSRQELAANIHARKLSLKRTGELLMALGYLKACEEKDEVLSWYEKLIAQEPTSFVYYSKLAGYYHELKMDDKALAPIQKALSLSEERQFLNLRLLAQIEKALNKKSEAIATISKALALPEAKLEKYKKYSDGLSEMQKSLSQ